MRIFSHRVPHLHARGWNKDRGHQELANIKSDPYTLDMCPKLRRALRCDQLLQVSYGVIRIALHANLPTNAVVANHLRQSHKQRHARCAQARGCYSRSQKQAERREPSFGHYCILSVKLQRHFKFQDAQAKAMQLAPEPFPNGDQRFPSDTTCGLDEEGKSSA